MPEPLHPVLPVGSQHRPRLAGVQPLPLGAFVIHSRQGAILRSLAGLSSLDEAVNEIHERLLASDNVLPGDQFDLYLAGVHSMCIVITL